LEPRAPAELAASSAWSAASFVFPFVLVLVLVLVPRFDSLNSPMSKARLWAYGLASSVITAVSNAGLTVLGVSGVNAVFKTDIHIEPRMLGIQCAVAGLIGMFAYLKQSPLPPTDSGQ
jgi:hypothetical protein